MQKIIMIEDVASNPTVYWMDVSDASNYIYIEKKKNKGIEKGHTKMICLTLEVIFV